MSINKAFFKHKVNHGLSLMEGIKSSSKKSPPRTFQNSSPSPSQQARAFSSHEDPARRDLPTYLKKKKKLPLDWQDFLHTWVLWAGKADRQRWINKCFHLKLTGRILIKLPSAWSPVLDEGRLRQKQAKLPVLQGQLKVRQRPTPKAHPSHQGVNQARWQHLPWN